MDEADKSFLLRVFASAFFANEAASYLELTIGQTMIAERHEFTYAIPFLLLAGFCALGLLFTATTAFLLFSSRRDVLIRGGNWGASAIAATSLCSILGGLGYWAMALFQDWERLGFSGSGVTRAIALFLLFGATMLLTGILGVAALMWLGRSSSLPRHSVTTG